MKEHKLPEWAFLDASTHEGDCLDGRTVVLHIRSATVIEIFEERERVNITPGALFVDFHYRNSPMKAVVHYSATLSLSRDSEYIKNNVLLPCAKWYRDYCEWEDRGFVGEIKAKLN